MKYLSCCAIGLLIAGTPAALSADAQGVPAESVDAQVVEIPSIDLDELDVQIPEVRVDPQIVEVRGVEGLPAISSIPDVQVETRVVTIPQVHADAHVIQVPEVRYRVTRDGDNRVEIVRQGTSSNRTDRRSKTDTSTSGTIFNQYFTGQNYQNGVAFSSPQMAKKTREVALLRQMLALKLTARDIERAIPLLKDLKEADHVVPAKPEQALDEEYNELLKARPGDPMPESSSQAMRDGGQTIRSRKLAIWQRMAQEIGLEKERGIRGMLRSEGATNWIFGGSGNGFFTAPSISTPAAPRLFRNRQGDVAPPKALAPAVPGSPALPESAVTAKPAEGDDDDRDARPGAVVPAKPEEDAAPEAASPDKPGKRVQKAVPAAPPATVLIAPGARALTLDSRGNAMRLFYSYSQVTVDELIDLFERKLAAMRH